VNAERSIVTVAESDVIEQFKRALAFRDIIKPQRLIADGKLHRCDAEGPNRKGDAAYVLHLDGIPAGGYENWRDGRGWENWKASIGRVLTPAEQVDLLVKGEAIRAQREADDAHRKAEAATRAETIWSETQPCVDYPYLVKKGIHGHVVRLSRDSLVVPLRNAEGMLRNLQFIRADGSKRFLCGAASS
jgi:putative DNA primase/helicase